MSTKPANAGSEHQESAVVAESGSGLYAQDISIGKHRLKGDEPESVGGGDAGPSPYAYLLAALGSCTSMTLRMYANRKGWPLKHVEVRLSHRKVHAEDCETCETKQGFVDRIERIIAIEGDLDEDQRTRLMEIADKCPVHRTLKSEVWIETKQA